MGKTVTKVIKWEKLAAKKIYMFETTIPRPLLIHNENQTKGLLDSKFAAMDVPFIWLVVPKILFKYSGPRETP